MKQLGEKTGDQKYLIYSKIFEKALHWKGAIDSINWNRDKHLIIMGEKDDNYQLTRSLIDHIDVEILYTLKDINHKNTFEEPKHSLNAIINFLQDGR